MFHARRFKFLCVSCYFVVRPPIFFFVGNCMFFLFFSSVSVFLIFLSLHTLTFWLVCRLFCFICFGWLIGVSWAHLHVYARYLVCCGSRLSRGVLSLISWSPCFVCHFSLETNPKRCWYVLFSFKFTVCRKIRLMFSLFFLFSFSRERKRKTVKKGY